MTWIKLDDNSPRHPKIESLSDRAFRWWIKGICYASEFLTDGLLPLAFIRPIQASCVSELVAAGLWIRREDGIEVHDYLQYQSSRADVEAERSRNRRRKGRGSPKGGTAVPPPESRAGTGAVPQPEIRGEIREEIREEEESAPPPRLTPLIGRGESMRFDRQQQAKHAGCHPEVCRYRSTSVRVCMPSSLVADFAGKLVGVDADAAIADVIRWALDDVPPAGTVVGSSEFRYWNARWDATRAQLATAPPKKSRIPDVAEIRAYYDNRVKE